MVHAPSHRDHPNHTQPPTAPQGIKLTPRSMPMPGCSAVTALLAAAAQAGVAAALLPGPAVPNPGRPEPNWSWDTVRGVEIIAAFLVCSPKLKLEDIHTLYLTQRVNIL